MVTIALKEIRQSSIYLHSNEISTGHVGHLAGVLIKGYNLVNIWPPYHCKTIGKFQIGSDERNNGFVGYLAGLLF